jgi:hypothetical protein
MIGQSKTGIGVHGKGGRLAGFFEGDVEVTGDIRLTNADCAEDFDISGLNKTEPGTVMVLGYEGGLCESQRAYDKRVAGVISGAAAAVLGLGDDFVGSANASIGDWNDGEEQWKTEPRLIEDPSFSEDPYNRKISVGDDDGEGKYTLYFNINMFKIDKVHV